MDTGGWASRSRTEAEQQAVALGDQGVGVLPDGEQGRVLGPALPSPTPWNGNALPADALSPPIATLGRERGRQMRCPLP